MGRSLSHTREVSFLTTEIALLHYGEDGWAAPKGDSLQGSLCSVSDVFAFGLKPLRDSLATCGGMRQEKVTFPLGSPSIVYRVTPKVCILRSSTPQPSPFTEILGVDVGDARGVEEGTEGGESTGSKAARESKIAGALSAIAGKDLPTAPCGTAFPTGITVGSERVGGWSPDWLNGTACFCDEAESRRAGGKVGLPFFDFSWFAKAVD